MNSLLQDLRYGLRLLRKNLAFTFMVVVALALGIGANSAIFSVLNAVVLRPLPYPEPDRLVMVGYAMHELSPANYLDLKEQNQAFENMGAMAFWNATLMGVDQPERLQGFTVTADLFRTIGVAPVLGQTFQPGQDVAGNDGVVVLSYELWKRRFALDPNIVGKSLIINTRQRTVIGVMPPDFQFYRPAEAWAPLVFDADDRQTRGGAFLIAAARLKPGTTIQQAQQDVNGISRRLEQQFPATNTNITFPLLGLHDSVVGIARLGLYLLLGAVAFVLLIACANVANLLLARAATRQKEIAIRVSVGAKRNRLIRQLLTESVVLSLIGGLVGLLIGGWAISVLAANIVKNNVINLPRPETIGLDRWVLFFTLGVSLLSAILFGLAPALQTSKPNLNETLKESGNTSKGVRSRRLRSVLVITEVALSFVLLICAGLMIRSFFKLLEVKTGFDQRQVLTMDLSLSPRKYPEPSQAGAFFTQALDKVKNIPGVTAVGLTSNLPLGGSDRSGTFYIEGLPTPVGGNVPRANLRYASPDYFRALGIPIKAGRSFTDQDNEKAVPVAVISEQMAKRYWPNEVSLGKRIRVVTPPGAPEAPWLTIVGVAGDVRHSALSAQPLAELYQMYAQTPLQGMTFVIRTSTEPLSMVAAVKNEVAQLDRDQPFYNIKSMEQVVSDSAALGRLAMVLLGVFAGVALVLSAVGVYGAMSYSVSQRTHEIGIRMALGASPPKILKLVVEQGMKLVLIGQVIGLIAAFALTRVLTGFLFGVSSFDPLTFGGVILLLFAVAIAACYFPARRATRVDPLIALRYQ